MRVWALISPQNNAKWRNIFLLSPNGRWTKLAAMTRLAPATTKHDEAAVAMRAVMRIFDHWQLSNTEARRLLGEPATRTFQRWKAGDVRSLPADTMFRLGTLLGIHKGLGYMFTEKERGYAWVRKGNIAFGGASTLDRMMQGTPVDLVAVRNYLDAERPGW